MGPKWELRRSPRSDGQPPSGGIPGGGVISESGGFGGLTAGFTDGATGNAGPQDPLGSLCEGVQRLEHRHYLTKKSYNSAKAVPQTRVSLYQISIFGTKRAL